MARLTRCCSLVPLPPLHVVSFAVVLVPLCQLPHGDRRNWGRITPLFAPAKVREGPLSEYAGDDPGIGFVGFWRVELPQIDTPALAVDGQLDHGFSRGFVKRIRGYLGLTGHPTTFLGYNYPKKCCSQAALPTTDKLRN